MNMFLETLECISTTTRKLCVLKYNYLSKLVIIFELVLKKT